MQKTTEIIVPDEVVMNKILLLRGKKVMIDSDLAALYGVATKRLNEQVKRKIERFPSDFMFRLTVAEKQAVISKYPDLQNLKFSHYLPFVFTEYGAVMLASVLNSDRAIQANIQVVRIFTRMRELMIEKNEFLNELEILEEKVEKHDEDILIIFKYLRKLMSSPSTNRKKIGYK
jgi:ORF6N domain-containing protein